MTSSMRSSISWLSQLIATAAARGPDEENPSTSLKGYETLRPTSPACRALGGERPDRCPPRPARRAVRRHVPSRAGGPPGPRRRRVGERQPQVSAHPPEGPV